jgi:hypothetical protein
LGIVDRISLEQVRVRLVEAFDAECLVTIEPSLGADDEMAAARDGPLLGAGDPEVEGTNRDLLARE